MSTHSFGPIDSSSLGRGSSGNEHGSSFLGRDSCVVEAGSSSLGSGTCVLEIGSSSKCSDSARTFEVGSSSHKAGSFIVSSILTPTFSNSPNFDDVAGYLVEPNNLDELKEKYIFVDKKMLQKALSLFAIKKNFEYITVKSSPERLSIARVSLSYSWSLCASRCRQSSLIIDDS